MRFSFLLSLALVAMTPVQPDIACPQNKYDVYIRCRSLVKNVEDSLANRITADIVNAVVAYSRQKTANSAQKDTGSGSALALRLNQQLIEGPLPPTPSSAETSWRSRFNMNEFFHFKWTHKISGALGVARDRVTNWITADEIQRFTSALQDNLNKTMAIELPDMTAYESEARGSKQISYTPQEQAEMTSTAAKTMAEYVGGLFKQLRSYTLIMLRDDVKELFGSLVKQIRGGVKFLQMMKSLGQHTLLLIRRTAAATIGALHGLLLVSLPIAIAALIDASMVTANPGVVAVYAATKPHTMMLATKLVERVISAPMQQLQNKLYSSEESSDVVTVLHETKDPSPASTAVPPGMKHTVADTRDAEEVVAKSLDVAVI
ncbi:hypothetical protein THASP1DRAFT_21954 [Thamnocephalis sphaerospora]|uniref:Root hair defective 3 GTP-binding protein-domain-containing protein n=1 Tax=Thamnocephalis sphaerospora TaxID=78915 RepID=A0A4P9XVK5_9FUNG|nr:hypothetical protein THASP1DRAFT_21954 [Thamnocephalis sphaerospora]|eukprot:RKP10303.1 hypothetical protein THASP1DRAFT_21954 [Thamnocephalis sphaerospora]